MLIKLGLRPIKYFNQLISKTLIKLTVLISINFC